MNKTKYFLSLALASAFLISGCSADETPGLTPKAGNSVEATASASPDNPPQQEGKTVADSTSPEKGEIIEVDGKEVEVYDGITPIPSDDVISADEQARFLISENERIRDEKTKGKPETVNISSDLREGAIKIYTEYSKAVEKKDFKKACTFVYPGENKTASDCLAYYESLQDQLDVSFNFDTANSGQNTVTGDIVFQQKEAPENGETIPRLTFTDREGTLLLFVPM